MYWLSGICSFSAIRWKWFASISLMTSGMSRRMWVSARPSGHRLLALVILHDHQLPVGLQRFVDGRQHLSG